MCSEKAPYMSGCYDNVNVISDNVWYFFSTYICFYNAVTTLSSIQMTYGHTFFFQVCEIDFQQ